MSALFPEVKKAGAKPLESAETHDFSVPYRHPYHLGLYLAVNAIPDAYTIIDGPDCLYRKAEWVHGTHDLRSTLLDVLGNHRVVPTLMNAEGVITSQGDEVVKRIRRVAMIPGAAIGLVCSMPHVAIIGTQYDRLIEGLRAELRLALVEVPSRSLEGDWLTGYTETLTAIANNLDVRERKPAPDTVAVIGHLMDRTEYDQQANVAELTRLVEALDLDVASVWLSDRPYAHLEQAKHASTLIALPHGLDAARALARRTGARVLEVPLPFGLGRTREFLRRIGAAFDRQALAARFADSETARLVPRLEWAVTHVFLGRRAVFSGDPALFGGFLDIAEEIGIEVAHLSAPARVPPDMEDLATDSAVPVRYAPSVTALGRELAGLRAPIDLAVGSTQFLDMTSRIFPRAASFELGFPSQRRHALCESPFLGYSGWIWLVNELARALSQGGENR